MKANNPSNVHMPLFAENIDIQHCLQASHGAPLKLVVDSLWSRPHLQEVPWVEPKWAFAQEGEKVIRPAFVPPKDVFQFSIADAHSRQDWHYHEYVYEMFVSDQPIALEYQEQLSGPVHHITVQNGFLMVPPGINHKVTLSGITYVFQVSLAAEVGIAKDKVIVPVQAEK
ncbi:MAG: hypothetical protein JNM22_21315 [Saprospiraceae bacterium]|nr:hypothetical protein [Saprospiraceae bacterium]